MAVAALLSGAQYLSIGSILALGLLGAIASSIWSWYRLRHIPGPFLAAFSPAWQLYTSLQGNMYIDLKHLNDRYGEIFRIGPREVIISDIDTVHRMSGPKSAYTRGPWYGTFRFMKEHDHLFSIVDESTHAALRTKMGPGYSVTSTMEAGLDAQILRFADLIERKFVSTDDVYRPVDFAKLAHYFAIDVVGEVSFGKTFGFLEEGEDVFEFLAWNDSFFPVFVTAGSLPGLSKLTHAAWFPNLLPKATDPVGLGRFIAFAQKAIQDRLRPDAETRRDMLGQWFQQDASYDETLSQAILSVVAGTDSVATALRMTLLYVINTPTVYSRLRGELDAAAAAGAISSPLKDAEAKRLPYLQAVLREGLRIFPGAASFFFKQVPVGGDTVCGHYLPAGTQVGTNVLGILRSKKYWGEDADVFRPERWLGVSEARLEQMNSLFEVQFGFGRYKCLGRPLAFLELTKTLPELLRRFDFAVVNPPSPVKIMNAGFFAMEGMWLRVTKRQHV